MGSDDLIARSMALQAALLCLFLVVGIHAAPFRLVGWGNGNSSGPPAFDEGIASIGLDLSNTAYCEADSIRDWSCVPCKRAAAEGVTPTATPSVIDGRVGGFGKIAQWGTRAIVAALSNERIVVSFRGSANLTNWIEDFDFISQVPYAEACPTCRVHMGFYKSWVSVARKVSDAVTALRAVHPKADILVTGHSLGAAMAALAATHFYYSLGLPVTHVYTYGQPRVGNKDFHHFYNNGTSSRQYAKPGASYRIVHWRDPVAQAPFRWMGYEHTSSEVWYNEKSTSHTVCDGTGEDHKCSGSLGFDLLAMADHISYLGRPTGGASCFDPPWAEWPNRS